MNSPPSFGVEADDFGNTRPVAFLKWQVVHFLAFSLSLYQVAGFPLSLVIFTFTFSRGRCFTSSCCFHFLLSFLLSLFQVVCFSLSFIIFNFLFSSERLHTFSCYLHFSLIFFISSVPCWSFLILHNLFDPS